MVMIYPSKGLFRGFISSSRDYGKTEVDHEHRMYAKKNNLNLHKIIIYTFIQQSEKGDMQFIKNT